MQFISIVKKAERPPNQEEPETPQDSTSRLASSIHDFLRRVENADDEKREKLKLPFPNLGSQRTRAWHPGERLTVRKEGVAHLEIPGVMSLYMYVRVYTYMYVCVEKDR